MTNRLITGATGMVGNALVKIEPSSIGFSSKEFDLTSFKDTKELFKKYQPTEVYHLAARVGGVQDNLNNNDEFFYKNSCINNNVLRVAYESGVRKVISILSTCVYPDDISYPLREKNIHNGEPHYTNFGYAYSKRMLEVYSRALSKRGKTKFLCVIPNNLYGEYDNFDLENSHVIPAIIRKIYEAKKFGERPVLWGDGSPLREFTYTHDLAQILKYLMDNDCPQTVLNVGNTDEISIRQLTEKISNYFSYDFDSIIWDTSRPKGQLRKPSDNSLFKQIKNFDYTNIDVGLEQTCRWFENTYPNVRGF
tara:strand:+ start:1796 stop:2716 length:921 start_codon:yes stop_codon:yes gene_type:complete